ncbi:MAG: pyruvate kinase [Chloroflexi bacterium]|nr:pyruvate kinase [Chloroflexota bacterium]|tara:strand:+ start:12729 stop:14150 length:1422 start_codon:yes stop_codon:yes gene_type:complete
MNLQKTKIVCTIGPSSDSLEIIEELIKSGMNVARINLSHGKEEDHLNIISNIRNVSKKLDSPIPILADLPGPKYRLGEIKNNSLDLSTDDELFLNCGNSNKDELSVWPPGLHLDVKNGAVLLVDDGAVELEITEINKTIIKTKVQLAGKITSNKAVVPRGLPSKLDYFTEETQSAINFVNSNDIDYLGLSYVRNVKDIIRVKEKIKDKNLKIISKIELQLALDNLEEIINHSDSIMVARGDLGVHLPISQVPAAQKFIINLCNQKGKEVITATQMLESMTENPQPTRAESTDVHNAVLDGSDAIMLSGETSIGKYPIRAVDFMREISTIAENDINHKTLRGIKLDQVDSNNKKIIDELIAHGAANIADQLDAKLIVAFTESGSTAARVAAYRPSQPVVAISPDNNAAINLGLRWGVNTINVESFDHIEDMFTFSENFVLEEKLASIGDTIVVVAGLPIGFKGNTNLIRVITIN